MFTKEKFLSFPPKTQAKKLADILKNIILYFDDKSLQAIKNHNTLVEWIGDEENKLPEDKVDTRLVFNKYTYWIQKADIGIDRTLYTHLSFEDEKEAKAPTIGWHVLLHNLRSAFNVGSVLRTMDCFGLEKAHFTGYTADASNKSVQSSAMGAESWMPNEKWNSPFECLENLPKDFKIIGLETSPEAVDLVDFEWPEHGLIVIGNEELGIPEELLKKCDTIINIPMYGRKNSLNVANAFSICAHDLRSKHERRNG